MCTQSATCLATNSIAQRLAFFTRTPIFLAMCVLNTSPIWLLEYYLTLDGPSHVNNWVAALQVFLGNQNFTDCLTFNPQFVPNWISHLVAMPLLSILSPVVVEKIIQSLVVIGIPWSLFSFIGASGGKREWAYLAIPFGYSMLFILGFYNFLFSVIFLFWALASLLKTQQRSMGVRIGWVALWSLVLYISHPLMLALLAAGLGLMALDIWKIQRRVPWMEMSLALFPVLVMGAFLVAFSHESTYTFVPTNELLRWISAGRCLVHYDQLEEKYTGVLVWAIYAAVTTAVIVSIMVRTNKENRALSFMLLLPFVAFMAYFILPDADGWAGYVSIRLLFVATLFLIACGALLQPHGGITLLALIVVSLCYGAVLYQRKGTAKALSTVSAAVRKAAEVLPDGASVLAVNAGDNWILSHAAALVATKVPVVCIENHECGTGYFPLVYTKSPFPFQIGTDNYFGFPFNPNGVSVEYIVSLGEWNQQVRPFGDYMKTLTDTNYTRIGADDGVYVYRRIEQ